MPPLTLTPRPVSLGLTPVEVAARLRHLPGLVFFDSARLAEAGGDLSLVAARPVKTVTGHLDRDFAALQEAVRQQEAARAPSDGLPHGFTAGTVDYDGAFCFGQYQDALIFRHADRSWHEVGELPAELREPDPCPSPAPLAFRPGLSLETYGAMVERAQAYIGAGDIYQVNLAHRFRAPWAGDPWGLYEALRKYSPAPLGAFLELGERTVLSASPESFLKMSGLNIRTRPIKGTRPRRAETSADAQSAADLLTSQKEIAELIMITDLERNDLGQVCEYGSVTAPELLKLERFEQVFHLVSTVAGRLRPDVDHATALRACFPGGSITGAPKKRAREIIAELEPEPRGLYTGAIGWFGGNTESHFSIAIRTIVMERGEAHFHVGAGIVADSIPAREWQETLDKAAGLLLAAERMNSV